MSDFNADQERSYRSSCSDKSEKDELLVRITELEALNTELHTDYKIQVDAICKRDYRIADLQAQLKAVKALPDKWRSREFSGGDMDNYSGLCADELEAVWEQSK